MKRFISTLIIASMLFVQLFIATACDGDKAVAVEADVFTVPEIDYQTYDNLDFSSYKGESELLPDQWEQYGTGDPFVMRYNGTYYLYPSTKDYKTGVRGWKSKDLIHWEKCNPNGLQDENGNEILPAGYVSVDDAITGAYAPEVHVFDGVFYMYSSPQGKGHYVFRSESPEGPFVKVTENFGMNIDGSVFIDDDESLYFMTADGSGITIRTMQSMTNIDVNNTGYRSATLGNSSVGGWTEGPMMIKRDGVYYMTYSGSHVMSEGYRIGYSVETEGNDLVSRNAFKKGAGSPVLLKIDEDNDFKGLGHSSTVLGPDLDSYYIVYHTLKNSQGLPQRSMAIDRLIFNGTQMSVDGTAKNSIVASKAEFTAENADELVEEGGKLLSEKSSGNVFTAEYNFSGNGVKCLVSYKGENDYYFVTADYSSKKISLVKHGSTDTTVAEGTFKNQFSAEKLHTVRIAYANGKADVYFDNMKKISDVSVTLGGGKIGYETEKENVYFTSFSNVAKGLSDRLELKKSGAQTGASNYLPENAYEGVRSYKLGGKSGLYKVAIDDKNSIDKGYGGAYALKLGENGDFARYLNYVEKDGHYGIKLTYESKYAGSKIGVQVNSGEVNVVTLPSVETDVSDAVITTFIDEYDFKSGVNFLTFYGVKDETAFISYSLEEKSYGEFTFENPLNEVLTEGAKYTTMYRMMNGGHTTRGGSIMLCYIGDDTLNNFEVEVDMRFLSVGSFKAGLLIRAKNFAIGTNDSISSVQGYFVGIDTRLVTFSKFNYGDSSTNAKAESHGVKKTELTDHTFKLKVRAEGNTITVTVDGKEIIKYTDAHAFLTGHIGLYSSGAEVVYKNIKIKGI